MIIEHFVPDNNLDEISKILNVHAEITGAQSDIYNLVSEHWCTDKNGEINLQCRHRILQDGLLKYPDCLVILFLNNLYWLSFGLSFVIKTTDETPAGIL